LKAVALVGADSAAAGGGPTQFFNWGLTGTFTGTANCQHHHLGSSRCVPAVQSLKFKLPVAGPGAFGCVAVNADCALASPSGWGRSGWLGANTILTAISESANSRLAGCDLDRHSGWQAARCRATSVAVGMPAVAGLSGWAVCFDPAFRVTVEVLTTLLSLIEVQ
jgi:hypothetical protein